MIKQTLRAVALAAVLVAPAFAQQSPSAPPAPQATPGTSSQQSGGQKPGFVQSQTAGEWRGSKLIGASVYGPDNQSIGEISDLIVDASGKLKAAVVGVGGFVGVGQKDVAVPFEALHVTPRQSSSSIDKITVTYTKDELRNAPTFVYYEASGAGQTTGSSTSAPAGRSGNNPAMGK